MDLNTEVAGSSELIKILQCEAKQINNRGVKSKYVQTK